MKRGVDGVSRRITIGVELVPRERMEVGIVRHREAMIQAETENETGIGEETKIVIVIVIEEEMTIGIDGRINPAMMAGVVETRDAMVQIGNHRSDEIVNLILIVKDATETMIQITTEKGGKMGIAVRIAAEGKVDGLVQKVNIVEVQERIDEHRLEVCVHS